MALLKLKVLLFSCLVIFLIPISKLKAADSVGQEGGAGPAFTTFEEGDALLAAEKKKKKKKKAKEKKEKSSDEEKSTEESDSTSSDSKAAGGGGKGKMGVKGGGGLAIGMKDVKGSPFMGGGLDVFYGVMKNITAEVGGTMTMGQTEVASTGGCSYNRSIMTAEGGGAYHLPLMKSLFLDGGARVGFAMLSAKGQCDHKDPTTGAVTAGVYDDSSVSANSPFAEVLVGPSYSLGQFAVRLEIRKPIMFGSDPIAKDASGIIDIFGGLQITF